MARTIQQIIDAINEEANKYPELKPLQEDPSNVPIWKAMVRIFADVSVTNEQMQDRYKEEVNQLVLDNVPATPQWIVQKAKEYQHGDKVIVENHRILYDPVNIENRVVTQAAVVTTGTTITLKVAKGNIPNLEGLTTGERTGLQTYIDNLSAAGQVITVGSAAAHLVSLHMKVEYSPEVWEVASTGTTGHKDLLRLDGENSFWDEVRKNVEELEFNGVLRDSDVICELRKLPGIFNVNISIMIHTPPGESQEAIPHTFALEPAGNYFRLESLSTATNLLTLESKDS